MDEKLVLLKTGVEFQMKGKNHRYKQMKRRGKFDNGNGRYSGEQLFNKYRGTFMFTLFSPRFEVP